MRPPGDARQDLVDQPRRARACSPACPNPLVATRYHSLVVDAGAVPPELEVSAWAEDGTVMGLRHRTLAVEGVQFHPESILTEGGHRLLANWLAVVRPAGGRWPRFPPAAAAWLRSSALVRPRRPRRSWVRSAPLGPRCAGRPQRGQTHPGPQIAPNAGRRAVIRSGNRMLLSVDAFQAQSRRLVMILGAKSAA